MGSFEIGDLVYSNSFLEKGVVRDIQYKRDMTLYLVEFEIQGEQWCSSNDLEYDN